MISNVIKLSMNVQYQQHDYDLITDAAAVQTALAPVLFRRDCPSGYVTHLCKYTRSEAVGISLFLLTDCSL